MVSDRANCKLAITIQCLKYNRRVWLAQLQWMLSKMSGYVLLSVAEACLDTAAILSTNRRCAVNS